MIYLVSSFVNLLLEEYRLDSIFIGDIDIPTYFEVEGFFLKCKLLSRLFCKIIGGWLVNYKIERGTMERFLSILLGKYITQVCFLIESLEVIFMKQSTERRHKNVSNKNSNITIKKRQKPLSENHQLDKA